MNWFKKYGWYILISFISAILGGVICISISHKNLGSFADWLSGLGSIAAIGVAYYQIYEQRNEYEKDKREANERFEFNNRSQFSILCVPTLNISDKNFFMNKEDETLFAKSINSEIDEVNGRKFKALKNDKRAYQFTNVTDNVAINVNIEIGYINNLESDNLQITFIPPRDKVVVLTHQMLNDKTKNSFLEIEKKIKYIKLYFESLSGKQYVQVWDKSTFTPSGENKIINTLSSETTAAKEMPKASNTINFLVGKPEKSTRL